MQAIVEESFSTPSLSPQALAAQACAAATPRLQRALRAAFPRACPGRIDDAVQEAALACVLHPERLLAALDRGGPSAARALLRTVAWRHLRGQYRKRCNALEAGLAEPGPLGHREPGQDVAASVALELGPALALACATAGAGDAAEVQDALMERILTGDSDSAVARRTGVRREYINRARRSLQQHLRDELGWAA